MGYACQLDDGCCLCPGLFLSVCTGGVSLSSQIHSMSSLVWSESNGPLAGLPPHQLPLALPDSLKPAGSGITDDHLVFRPQHDHLLLTSITRKGPGSRILLPLPTAKDPGKL